MVIASRRAESTRRCGSCQSRCRCRFAGCRCRLQVVVEVSQASCCVVFSSLPIEFRRRPGLCFLGGRQGQVMQLLQDEVVDEAPGFLRACGAVRCVRECAAG
jgi:hypothetical protein